MTSTDIFLLPALFAPRMHTVKPCPREAFEHKPFGSVFQDHRLNSTTKDITTALLILKAMSLYYFILWNQVDIL